MLYLSNMLLCRSRAVVVDASHAASLETGPATTILIGRGMYELMITTIVGTTIAVQAVSGCHTEGWHQLAG